MSVLTNLPDTGPDKAHMPVVIKAHHFLLSIYCSTVLTEKVPDFTWHNLTKKFFESAKVRKGRIPAARRS